MNYADARQKIKSGDVLLWRCTGLVPWLIRKITKSQWAHVGIAIWWGDRLMVVDSYPVKGTRARPLGRCIDTATWLPMPPLEGRWTAEASSFALEELGRGYSYQNLFKTWMGLNLARSGYHCAQYAGGILERCGLKLSWPPTPESIYAELRGFLNAEALTGGGDA